MRLAAPLAVLLLAACGGDGGSEKADAAAGDGRIECMAEGTDRFERVCTAEWGEARSVTVRKPDGGFRRLIARGEGYEAADGAEPARVSQLGDGRLEVAIGVDRFRLPAEAPR